MKWLGEYLSMHPENIKPSKGKT